MKQQPDNLFHNKLEQLHMPAPEAAWDRIESNLNKKKSLLWVWKVAAVLVPLAAVLFYVLPNDKNTEAIAALPDTTPVVEQPSNAAIETIIPKINVVAEVTTNQKKRALHKNQLPSSVVVQKITLPSEEVTVAIAVENTVTPQEVVQPETQSENSVIASEFIKEAIASNTLLLPAEEVNQKYLVDPSLLDATSGKQTSSSLQRLLEKAADLKNNKHGLGNLRQAKNEILALNFKSKKRERNN